MELIQSFQTRTTLAMTQRMLASLRVLQMSNSDLTDYLTEKAQENPCIELRLPSGAGGAGGEDFDQIAALRSDSPSLYSHVADQIELAFDDPKERRVAFGFLEALEPSGWMTTDPCVIALSCQVSSGLADAVLSQMKAFEPAGLFAGSLAECLRLQAEDRGVLTWELEALIENLPLLADGRRRELAELCDCEIGDLPEIIAILKQFDPKPGQSFLDDRPPVFPPDLTATRTADGWTVELNRSNLPSIAITDKAMPPLDRSHAEARAYRTRALSEARWLASALIRRQTTLLQTATAIISRQGAFLEDGSGSLRPLSLADIGEVVELHPSTISRAIAGRMIDTPIGALPLKSFFSRSFPSSQDGMEHSQQSVLKVVQRIVSTEDATKPLSDTAIAALAAKEGVTIARRTVAKFRGVLGIASSYARRVQSAVA